MATRLKEQEIDQALARLRAEYDHYIVHFFKPAEAKWKFEDRLTQALRARMDLGLFIAAELGVIKTLLSQAEQEAQEPPREKPKTKKAPASQRPQSYADRLIAQMRARIQGYPALGLPEHPQKSLDVDKIYGTLRWFRREIWDVLYPVMVKKIASPLLFRLDDELMSLTLQGDHWPKEVEVYVSHLTGSTDLATVARAQNRCLLQAAQYLHRLRAFLDGCVGHESFVDHENNSLQRAVAFCDRVLSDFRLKDLQPHRN